MEANRRFQRVLRRVEMTPEQFMGLMLAVGTAMNKSQLADQFDFDGFIERGEKVVFQLKRNRIAVCRLQPRPAVFADPRSGLAVSGRSARNAFAMCRAKTWNSSAAVGTELATIFPAEFQVDPLGTIADRLEEQGIPFEELPETGSDATIQWNPDEAIIGTDPSPLLPKQTSGK